jgi:hypothetical protein
MNKKCYCIVEQDLPFIALHIFDCEKKRNQWLEHGTGGYYISFDCLDIEVLDLRPDKEETVIRDHRIEELPHAFC